MVGKTSKTAEIDFENESNEQHPEEISLAADENVGDSAKDKDSRNVLVIIGILIAILALTIGGFAAYNHFTGAAIIDIDFLHQQNLEGNLNEDEGYVYKGYSFVKADGLWWTGVEVKDRIIKIPLHYGPREVEHIPITGKLTPEFNQGEKVYVAIDPEVNYDKYYTLSLMELNNNILQGVNRNIEAACSKENPVCENRTIINCENSNGQPVVELAVSETPRVSLQGTCIKIEGSGEDLVKSVDTALFMWYKIMN